MAQGMAHTHAAKAELTLDALADWTAASGAPGLAAAVRGCNTAREAFGLLAAGHPAAVAEVGRRMRAAAGRFAGPGRRGAGGDLRLRGPGRAMIPISTGAGMAERSGRRRIHVVGLGVGPDELTAAQRKIIERAEVLVGGRRLLARFADSPAEKHAIGRDVDEVDRLHRPPARAQAGRGAGLGRPALLRHRRPADRGLRPQQVAVHPNVSSVAAACARPGRALGRAAGREPPRPARRRRLLRTLAEAGRAAVLTDPDHGPAWIAGRVRAGLGDGFRIGVAEALGEPGERTGWYGLADGCRRALRRPERRRPQARGPHGPTAAAAAAGDAGVVVRARARADHEVRGARGGARQAAARPRPRALGPRGGQRRGRDRGGASDRRQPRPRRSRRTRGAPARSAPTPGASACGGSRSCRPSCPRAFPGCRTRTASSSAAEGASCRASFAPRPPACGRAGSWWSTPCSWKPRPRPRLRCDGWGSAPKPSRCRSTAAGRCPSASGSRP
ncbi:MAG: SAM-dependent methyltransferase [Desulfobacterales bacterium]|nr:SAM-dependent methyltransferase [Desulfobacterales bacterium]